MLQHHCQCAKRKMSGEEMRYMESEDMGKLKAKHKDKFNCAIRQKHISRFFILAVLMVAGIFLILPASTAQGWPFDEGDTGLGTTDRGMDDGMDTAANQPPVISDLESSPSSPQLCAD